MAVIDIHNHLSSIVNLYKDSPHSGPTGPRTTPIADDRLRVLGQEWIEKQDRIGITRAFVFDWDWAAYHEILYMVRRSLSWDGCCRSTPDW